MSRIYDFKNKEVKIEINSIRFGNSAYINQPREVIDYIRYQQEEIKRLNKELVIRIQNSQYLVRKYDELEEIIIELEKCFEKTWQDYKDSESENLYAIAIENKSYLDKLQELKDSDKE